MDKMSIKKFVKERDKALLSLNAGIIRTVFSKYGVELPVECKVFWAAIHKARIEIISFPEDEKEISRKWLIDNDFYPGIQ